MRHLGARRRLLGIVGAVTAGAAVLLTASPAWAEPSGRIAQVEPSGSGLQILFAGDGLPESAELDPASVAVTLDGQATQAIARPVLEAPEPIARTALLAIDTSGSMNQDGRITAAITAAKAFLSATPADVSVGLLTFDDEVTVVTTPTTDRARVTAAVNALKADGGTRLYDGLLRGVDVLGTEGSRTLVLLSDGADEGSKANLAAASTALATSGTSVQAISLGDGAPTTTLQQLASAAHGTVIPATEAADLAGAFAQAARALVNQLVIDVTVPAALAGRSASIAVSAQAGSARLADTVFAPLPETAAPTGPGGVPADAAPVPAQLWTGPGWLDDRAFQLALVALFAGLAGLLTLAVLGVTHKDSRSERVTRRLSIYTLTGRRPVKKHQAHSALGSSSVARSAVELAGRVVARRDLETRLGHRLEAAGLPLKPAEWLIIHAGIAFGAGLLALLLSGATLLVTLVGLGLGAVAPWFYLSAKESRRTAAFLAQMPDTLQLLAGSLSAGYSFPQAMDTVVREGQVPMTTEFNRALIESRLGVPIEDALDGIATRMKSVDFSWVVMAIRIQREVGGNLGEVLTTVAATLREREQLRRQVKVLSAEGRLSGWIIGALPPMFALFLVVFRPEYLKPLITSPLGLSMIATGLIMQVVGVIIMRQVVKVEV